MAVRQHESKTRRLSETQDCSRRRTSRSHGNYRLGSRKYFDSLKGCEAKVFAEMKIMTTTELMGVLGGMVGLVGGGAGILSAFYQRKQTRLMQEQISGLRSRDTS